VEVQKQEGTGVTCVAWSTSQFDVHPEMLATASDKEVKIWVHTEQRKWVVAGTIPHTDVVHDVAWAPNSGRSYHLLATASKDRVVRIFKLLSKDAGPRVDFVTVAEMNDHNAEVWRVEWNLTGTVLASSGDDGRVRLWKASHAGTWGPLSIIAGDSEEAAAADSMM